MPRYTRSGAVYGLLGSLVFALISAVSVYLLFSALKPEIMKVIASSIPPGSGLTAQQLYPAALAVAVALVAIISLIAGTIFGAIYGYAYGGIPGSTPFRKAIVFSLILWFIVYALVDLADIREYGITYYLTNIGTGIIASLAWGAIVGTLMKRKVENEREPIEDYGGL